MGKKLLDEYTLSETNKKLQSTNNKLRKAKDDFNLAKRQIVDLKTRLRKEGIARWVYGPASQIWEGKYGAKYDFPKTTRDKVDAARRRYDQIWIKMEKARKDYSLLKIRKENLQKHKRNLQSKKKSQSKR